MNRQTPTVRPAHTSVRFAQSLGVALCCFPLAACAQSADPPPASEASRDLTITLDGHASSHEWDGAEVHDLTGSGSVSILQDDDHVYLAVQDDAFGWSHVYVPDGDTVRVLHASAALGTALYVRDAEGWQLREPFKWGVRDTTFSAAAEAERAAFFDRHGWVANTNRMGSRRVIEFQIDKGLFGPSGPRLAVLYAEDPADPHRWPAGLADATLDPDLIRGAPPERLTFLPDTWSALAVD